MDGDTPVCGLPDPVAGICTDPREPDGKGGYLARCSNHRGMPVAAPEEGGAFTAQNPSHGTAGQVRAALIEQIVKSLEHLEGRGLAVLGGESARRRAAGVILDDLAADVLTRTLTGMAMGSVQA